MAKFFFQPWDPSCTPKKKKKRTLALINGHALCKKLKIAHTLTILRSSLPSCNSQPSRQGKTQAISLYAMIEEINDDDIDNMDFDPSDFDPQNVIGASQFDSSTGARLVPNQPAPAAAARKAPAPFHNPMNDSTDSQLANTKFLSSKEDIEQFKTWSLLYPCYFDAARSHAEGRRVSRALAVENPQAETIMHALRALAVPAMLEANKTHPKDWANTGRVRYLLKDDEITDLRSADGFGAVRNKRHLLLLVAQYLREHPTTPETPFQSMVFEQMKKAPGYNGEKHAEPLAVPRGWKLNSILPVMSPAITGGKAPEQLMEQMSGGLLGGLGGLGGAGGATPNVPAVPKKPKRINIRR